MTRLEFVDLLVDLLLGILYRLTHLVSGLVRLVGCGVLVRLLHFFCSVFGVAPSLLCRTFGLIRNSLIGELFVADSFSKRFALPFPPPAQPCQKPDPYSLFFSLSPQMRRSFVREIFDHASGGEVVQWRTDIRSCQNHSHDRAKCS